MCSSWIETGVSLGHQLKPKVATGKSFPEWKKSKETGIEDEFQVQVIMG